MASQPADKRMYVSSLLTAAGLIVQLLTLLWVRPLAFVTFLVIGVPLVAAGALLYLYALLRGGQELRSR